MKRFLAVAVAAVLFSGCAALKQRSVANDVQTLAGTAQLVCATLGMFEPDAPEPEVCQKAMAGINSEFYPVVYDVAVCIDSHNLQSPEFVTCIDDVDGWATVAGLLAR